MKIGIVTTWFERGAAYVSRQYMEALQENNEVFIYARGGEEFGKENEKWDLPNVTWGVKYGVGSFKIRKSHLYKWIKKHDLDIILFNEQREWKIVADVKKDFENICIGAYIDYYTEKTINLYDIYDFVLCNTQKHYDVFKGHKQACYLRWGTDVELFQPSVASFDQTVFFHSVGMAYRKGTDILVDAFVSGKLYEEAKLILHSQIPIERVCGYTKKQLESYGIEVIEETVTAPGLYYKGNVYVYPTKLEGLGLTLYEALACGLPVITTDFSPMNEVIDNEVGSLVKVSKLYSREDGYYWPMAECDKDDLISKMKKYITNKDMIKEQSLKARKKAVEIYNWSKAKPNIQEAFSNFHVYPCNDDYYKKIVAYSRKESQKPFADMVKNSSLLYFIYKVLACRNGA